METCNNKNNNGQLENAAFSGKFTDAPDAPMEYTSIPSDDKLSDEMEMLIDEYSLVDHADLTETERKYVEALLAADNYSPTANKAKQYLKECRTFNSLFRYSPPVTVPTESINRVNKYLDSLIQKNTGPRAKMGALSKAIKNIATNNSLKLSRNHKYQKLSLNQRHVNFRLNVLCCVSGIAAAVCLALGVLSYCEEINTDSIVNKGTGDYFSKIQGIDREFALQINRVEPLATSSDNLRKIIYRCTELLRNDIGIPSQIHLRKVIYKAYEHIGDLDEADNAFFSYAKVFGEYLAQEDTKIAYNTKIIAKDQYCQILFARAKQYINNVEYMRAITILQNISSKAQNEETKMYAYYLLGACYCKYDLPDQAEQYTQRLLKDEKYTDWAQALMRHKAVLLLNQYKPKMAIDTWERLASGVCDETRKNEYLLCGVGVAITAEDYIKGLLLVNDVICTSKDRAILARAKNLREYIIEKVEMDV